MITLKNIVSMNVSYILTGVDSLLQSRECKGIGDQIITQFCAYYMLTLYQTSIVRSVSSIQASVNHYLPSRDQVEDAVYKLCAIFTISTSYQQGG